MVKRTGLARIVPPPIELVNWDEVDGQAPRRRTMLIGRELARGACFKQFPECSKQRPGLTLMF